MNNKGNRNRLATSNSPYLLSHADNPVDWYPWGDEAFKKAKLENKPIFLSIGYSTCHWCHVMERESFKDPEVAEILNRHFISIKVDREERPDVDNVYMTFCQALTGRGGWPLTVMITPDKKPFFAGTYFPKTGNQHIPGLLELLPLIAGKWQTDQETLTATAQDMIKALQDELNRSSVGNIDVSVAAEAYRKIETSFDPLWGGFGSAPKFPLPGHLFFLLAYHRTKKHRPALKMVEQTLAAIRLGGIYDQFGYGLSRYSTDREWLIPHFEKMLYDNALLALAYLETYQTTKKNVYADVAREIFRYLLDEMRTGKGFATAQDADTEGEEGLVYTWTPAEIAAVLGDDAGKRLCSFYGISPKGNFENGRSVPNLSINIPPPNGEPWWQSFDSILHEAGLFEEQRLMLLNARKKRPQPLRDDKVLTAWNGLALAALARGGRILHDESLTIAAKESADFLLGNLRDENGLLKARYRKGEARYDAYLDDYAFLSWGLLELFETTYEPSYLQEALDLVQEEFDLFWDQKQGGLFFTKKGADELPFRSKDFQDGALPSGNSVTAMNLVRLGQITGREDLTTKANDLFKALGGAVSAYPSGFSFLLSAWMTSEEPPREVIISGTPEEKSTRELVKVVYNEALPGDLIFLNPGGSKGTELGKLVPSLADKMPGSGPATAYVCQGFTCHQPTQDPKALWSLLREEDNI